MHCEARIDKVALLRRPGIVARGAFGPPVTRETEPSITALAGYDCGTCGSTYAMSPGKGSAASRLIRPYAQPV